MNGRFGKRQIVSAVVIIAAAAAWLNIRHGQIQEALLERYKTTVASDIHSRASAMLKPEDIGAGDSAAQRKALQIFFAAIQSPQLVRMKVWDRDFTVLWSDLQGLIGRRFLDNHEVKEALEGRVEFAIDKEKNEPVSERASLKLGQLYLPIAEAKGQIVGVIEVYQPTEALRQEIHTRFKVSAVIALAVAGLLIAIMVTAPRFIVGSVDRGPSSEHVL